MTINIKTVRKIKQRCKRIDGLFAMGKVTIKCYDNTCNTVTEKQLERSYLNNYVKTLKLRGTSRKRGTSKSSDKTRGSFCVIKEHVNSLNSFYITILKHNKETKVCLETTRKKYGSSL